MRRTSITVVLALATVLFVSTSSAQQAATTTVPNLIRYGGTLKDAQGTASIPSTTVGVAFAIYKQQDGGAPIWMETQNVTPDASGNYGVLLGSTTATGLPADLFSQQEQRWLGVQVQGQAEQTRVLLVSVPYAMKAAEAETLGGLPASAFVKAAPTDTSSNGSNGSALNALSNAGSAGGTSTTKGKTASGKPKRSAPCATIGGGGTLNFIPLWTPDGCTLGDSLLSQLTAGRVDVNGNLDLASTSSAYQIGASNVLSIGNSADDNLFLGLGAGTSNVAGSGQYNVFSGYQAGYSNTTGNRNTFVGYQAGLGNTSGVYNTFTGEHAGRNNTRGSFNTFSGAWAGYNTASVQNTFIGTLAGFQNATGSRNTFVGMNAGPSVVTGVQNTFLGYNAGVSAGAAASNDVYIANQGVASDNGVMRIGDPANQTAAYVAGIYGSTTSGGSAVFVDATGKMGTAGGSVLTVPNGGSGATSFAAYAPVVGGTSTTGALQSTAVGRARQVFVSGGSGTVPAYIDFPDTKIIPAANCIAGTAGAGWSNAASNFTAACRAGSSNLGGALQAIPVTGAVAQFMLELPADWDTATQPYISIYYGSGANSSGTVIWTVSSACSQMNGSTTDDPAFVAEPAFAPQTMAAASRTWARNGQFTRMTGSNNCVAGSSVIIKVAVSGTAASAINAYQAVVTIPRLLTVQAN